MSGKTNDSRKALRRQATIDEIVDAAWNLSRANGLGNFSMRELGEAVNMRAQSIYSYFASKHEIYDAMFAAGNRAFLEAMVDAEPTTDDDHGPEEAAAEVTRRFFRFCTSDPVRYQLLFQRTIPGFEPSASSYAVAQDAYDCGVAPFRQLGLDDDDLDLVTALMAGLVAQQLANDPTGDRWERLIPRAARMLLDEATPQPVGAAKTRRTK